MDVYTGFLPDDHSQLKVPDHPAFAMKTEKWGIPNGRI